MFIVGLVVAAALLELRALRTQRRGPRIAMHVASGLIAFFCVFTYEIAIPLVGLMWLLSLAAYGRRRDVLIRAGVDMAIAGGYAVYRTAVPYPPDVSFTVERTTGESIRRAWDLVYHAGGVWRAVFAPGPWVAAVAILIAGAVVLAALNPGYRRAVRPLAIALALAAVTGAAAVLVYVRSHPYYTPDLGSFSNRTNLGATIPGCVAFVRADRPAVPRLAPAHLGPLGGDWWSPCLSLRLFLHAAAIERKHQTNWIESWRVQEQAAAAYATLARDLPVDAVDRGLRRRDVRARLHPDPLEHVGPARDDLLLARRAPAAGDSRHERRRVHGNGHRGRRR